MVGVDTCLIYVSNKRGDLTFEYLINFIKSYHLHFCTGSLSLKGWRVHR